MKHTSPIAKQAAYLPIILPLLLFACSNGGTQASADNVPNNDSQQIASISPVDKTPFDKTDIATLKNPWAMAFMPGSSMLLVTSRTGEFNIVDTSTGALAAIKGQLPEADEGGQGGLGDIAFSPEWKEGDTKGLIYLSWVEAGTKDTRGAVVGRGQLNCPAIDQCSLSGLKVIWRQDPKVTGRGHYSHRIAFSRDGQYIYISSGERQKMHPAQDITNTLGTIVRLNLDGSVPEDNPFAERGGESAKIWSLGHRNILGLAFDNHDNLWETEMGPKGGDELNIIRRGENYGWPVLSNGVHYDGKPIPDHTPYGEEDESQEVAGGALGYTSPKISWVPSISPANLMYYDGALFPEWQGSLFIGGLSGETLIRVKLDDQEAEIANRWSMDARIREVEQGPEGAIWLLTDGSKGKLIKLTPPQ